jgi:two-component system chemotaxis response regulator CheY
MIDGLREEDIGTLLEECHEKLDDVDACLIAISEDSPKRSGEWVNRLFRGFHSVKGAAAYLEHGPLTKLSHATESVLAEVRDGTIKLSNEHIELLLSSSDRMREMVANGQLRKDVEFGKELEGLNSILLKQPQPAQPPAAVARMTLRPSLAPHLRPLRVLAVEDDFSSRIVLQGLLSKYGECHIAVNGKEAVEAFRLMRSAGQSYDLICLDIRMPEMDGQEALELIRTLEGGEGAQFPGVRIFMTTSIGNIKTVIASFKALCDAYLIKPVDGRALEEHLRSFRLIGDQATVRPRQPVFS